MATATDTTAPQAPGPTPAKGGKRRIRKLEKRLTAVRAVEAKRTRQAEKATQKGAAKLAAKRGRQLEKAGDRSATLEGRIAELRATAPLEAVKPESNGSAKARVAKRQGTRPTVLRAFCLRERKNVEMQDPKPMVMSNGRSATVGTCPSCGVRVIRPG